MEFIEAPAFTRHISEYLDPEQYRAFQGALAADPEMGDVMPGTGGFRKVRWVETRRGKGKRGGLRIIYYHLLSDHQIWLMTIYGKDEAADLTADDKKVLKASLEAELKTREFKRKILQRKRARS